ncbi:Alpha/Beta hydrolase protein [Flagelloscypha sp. PMI_526]|nr:Alpha/Beta hydrolase protein [Flagelloscypha sp. PMI_526]
MQTIQLAYKKDDAGFDLVSFISFVPSAEARPIVIVYHGGGLVVGDAETPPLAQIKHLTEVLGFIVVSPNYRLAPQVSASKGALKDAFDVLEWTYSTLPTVIQEHGVIADSSKIVTMGHSSGASLALIMASAPHPPKAILSFYSGLYVSEPDSAINKPYFGFAHLPPFVDSEEAQAALFNPLPNGQQLSAYPLMKPGTLPGPRALWHMSNLAKGTWMEQIEFGADANPAALDPATYLTNTAFPPVMMLQGDADDVPGSTLDMAERFAKQLQQKGGEVTLVPIAGAKHMFDMMLAPGQDGWEVVEKGLKFLSDHVQ